MLNLSNKIANLPAPRRLIPHDVNLNNFWYFHEKPRSFTKRSEILYTDNALDQERVVGLYWQDVIKSYEVDVNKLHENTIYARDFQS